MLAVGCRHPQADELYAEELAALATAAGVELAPAYSQIPGQDRVYVQDRVRRMGEQVMTMLDAGGRAYVCGGSAMADGVRATLVELRQDLRDESPEDAERWLRQLTADRRVLVDVWASG